jgi:hypothetical protein
MYALRISPTIANEWNVRCIGDSIPALSDRIHRAGLFLVSLQALEEIIQDCKFMLDMNGPDLYPAERTAYRALLKQAKQALSNGPREPKMPSDAQFLAALGPCGR